MTYRVGALDIATKTGWCCDAAPDAPEGAPPASGVWHLPGLQDPDASLKSRVLLKRYVRALIRVYELNVLVVEAPMAGHAGSDRPKPSWLVIEMPKLIGAAEDACVDWEECTCGGILRHREACPAPRVMLRQASVQTARRHFVGHGRPDHPKLAVMRRCKDLNWPVQDDNAADAAALYCLVKSMACKGWAPKATPLFAGQSFDSKLRSRFA